jgi:glutaminase
MYTLLLDDDSLPLRISVRHLPPPEEVEVLVRQAFARYKDLNEGKVADRIPALVCEAIGCEEARGNIGVNATGRPFNSVMAVEATR